MKLIPILAFTDNYIWLMHDGHQALVVDLGDAQPVPEPLRHLGITLETILVTHHHADHTGGVDLLHRATGARVFCPASETTTAPLTRLSRTEQRHSVDRSFEGSPAPMLESLTTLPAPPEATRVCCTHEYTLSHLKFAKTADPANQTQ